MTASNRVTHTTTTTSEDKKNKEPPKRAKILSSTIRTETEEIENGFILSKNYDVTWEGKGGNREYGYYSKKWFSKTNPITVKVELPESLADKFE